VAESKIYTFHGDPVLAMSFSWHLINRFLPLLKVTVENDLEKSTYFVTITYNNKVAEQAANKLYYIIQNDIVPMLNHGETMSFHDCIENYKQYI